jgi:RNA polymerase sigma-19 factor, ECF subfamily
MPTPVRQDGMKTRQRFSWMLPYIDNKRFRNLLRSYPTGAIQLLYDLYYTSLKRIAWKLTHDENASEDIVQEAFLHVWEHSKKLSEHHERSIEHYLVRIVKNRSISHFKKKKPFSLEDSKNAPAHHYAIEDESLETMLKEEVIQEMRNIINTFPRRERECMLMRLDEELTPDEMANRLNITRKAVERSLTSAKKRLRKWALTKDW